MCCINSSCNLLHQTDQLLTFKVVRSISNLSFSLCVCIQREIHRFVYVCIYLYIYTHSYNMCCIHICIRMYSLSSSEFLRASLKHDVLSPIVLQCVIPNKQNRITSTFWSVYLFLISSYSWQIYHRKVAL